VADTVTNYTPSARGAGERERAPANTAFFPTAAAAEEIDKDPSDAETPTQKIKSLSKDTAAQPERASRFHAAKKLKSETSGHRGDNQAQRPEMYFIRATCGFKSACSHLQPFFQHMDLHL